MTNHTYTPESDTRQAKTTFQFIDAPAGRGKTEYIVQKSITAAGSGDKVVILAKQVALCEEIKHRIENQIAVRKLSAPINLKVIHHENCSGSVIGAIIHHINTENYPEGEILILTMAAYDLVNWKAFGLWVESRYLFIDEIPAVDNFYDRNLPDYHDIITKHMELSPSGVPGYSLIACSDIDRIKVMARNRGKDEVGDIFQPLAHVASSRYWTNWVEDAHHNRLLGGNSTRLQVHSLRDPACFAFGWKKVIIGGALFPDSLLYQIWSEYEDVEFIEEVVLPGPKNHHIGGELITFRWAIPGRMTKYKRNKLQGQCPQGFADAFVTEAAKIAQSMGAANNEIMFLTNKDDKTEFEEATRLPHSPYGTNEYLNYRYFVTLGAYNQNPAHEKFLMVATGLDRRQIWRATHFLTIYQGMMRGAMRNSNNKERVEVYVPDQQTVWNLKSYFPGCQEVGMGMTNWKLPEPKESGRPKKYADDATRKQESRKKAEWEQMVKEWKILNGLDEREG